MQLRPIYIAIINTLSCAQSRFISIYTCQVTSVLAMPVMHHNSQFLPHIGRYA